MAIQRGQASIDSVVVVEIWLIISWSVGAHWAILYGLSVSRVGSDVTQNIPV